MRQNPFSIRAFAARFRSPSAWINLLLVFVPIAIVVELLRGDPTILFITSALGIVPLAGLLGEATDALSVKAGDQIGGLLNATLGNAAELIITIVALQAGLLDVVKASITGSILGNLLLVLGLSLLAGGLKNGTQFFDRRGISVMMTTMTIAIIGLVIPTMFSSAIEAVNHNSVEYLSIGVAVALMASYILSLFFTLRGKPKSDEIAHAEEVSAAPHHHGPLSDLRIALAVLAVAVVLIAFLSEILVGAVEPLIQAQGLSELFVGVIIVPIIGNAAEHLVAVEMALKNRMELSIGIAVGSSLQIALFVAPVLVFIALLFGQQLTLVFNQFEIAALIAAVLITALIALDGESNWLEGAQLLIVYVILAIAFFFLPNLAAGAHVFFAR
ncbi:MAG: calcium/proton exchanger [Chloroflexota bacterium]|nr:MAG: calcium/proton exchanger [Chloroflexota bacterium]